MMPKFKSVREMMKLQPGDVIRHVTRDVGDGYLVVLNTGDSLVVQRTFTATNPDEWIPVIVKGERV